MNINTSDNIIKQALVVQPESTSKSSKSSEISEKTAQTFLNILKSEMGRAHGTQEIKK